MAALFSGCSALIHVVSVYSCERERRTPPTFYGLLRNGVQLKRLGEIGARGRRDGRDVAITAVAIVPFSVRLSPCHLKFSRDRSATKKNEANLCPAAIMEGFKQIASSNFSNSSDSRFTAN